MWNLFRKNKKTEYVSGFNFDFKTFNKFYQYLINEENHSIVEGLKDEAEMAKQ